MWQLGVQGPPSLSPGRAAELGHSLALSLCDGGNSSVFFGSSLHQKRRADANPVPTWRHCFYLAIPGNRSLRLSYRRCFPATVRPKTLHSAAIQFRPKVEVRILPRMSFTCLLGRHRPMLASIIKRPAGYTALCDDCGLPIERAEGGRWIAAEPLVSKRDRAA